VGTSVLFETTVGTLLIWGMICWAKALLVEREPVAVIS
jgi:hypothetical protein